MKYFHCGYGFGQFTNANPFTTTFQQVAPGHVRVHSETKVGAACLMTEDIDWNSQTICYSRRKLKSRGTAIKPALIRFGAEVEAILKRRPQAGALFP